ARNLPSTRTRPCAAAAALPLRLASQSAPATPRPATTTCALSMALIQVAPLHTIPENGKPLRGPAGRPLLNVAEVDGLPVAHVAEEAEDGGVDREGEEV